MKLPLAGGLQWAVNSSRSKDHSGATLVNMLVEPPYHEGDSGALIPFPGIVSVGTTAPNSGQINAMAWTGSNDLLYVIAAQRFYSVNIKTFVWTDLVGAALVQLSLADPGYIEFLGVEANGDPTYIVFGSSESAASAYYHHVATATTGDIGSLGVTGSGSTSATFLDGRIILQDKANVGRFYYSDVLDPTAWSALNFATAEAQIDALRAVLASNRELYLFGSKSTEVWFSTGDANAPYRRFQGGVINMGLVGPQTARRFNGSVAWLARNEAGELQVCMMGQGYVPQVISPPGMIDALAGIERPEKCYAYVFQVNGHEVYCLNIPYYLSAGSTSYTFCYDALTQQWSQWGGVGSRSVARSCCYAGNMATTTSQSARVFVGGTAGKLGYLSAATAAEFGVNKTMSRVMPKVKTSQVLTRCSSVTAEVGYMFASDAAGAGSTAAADAAVGATSITLAGNAAAAGFSLGVQLVVVCEDGSSFTSITTSTNGNIVVFYTPLPVKVLSGATVYAVLPTTVKLSVSTNGGFTWKDLSQLPVPNNPNILFPRGKHLSWRKIGVSRDWSFMLTVQGAAPFEIRDVDADFLVPQPTRYRA